MLVALAVLVLALPAALYVAWPLRRRRPKAAVLTGEDPRAAVEAEKTLALRAIRELEGERQAGLLAEADYAELRARYEARAAAILEQLDALGPPSPAPPPARRRDAAAPPTPAAPVPWTQRPFVLASGAVAVLAFGIVLGVLAVRYTGPEASGPMAATPEVAGPAMPGGGVTPGGEGAPRPLPKEMLDGMLRAAHASLDAGRYQEAIAAYKAVLKRDPRNVEAITHLGLILAIAGHTDGALEAFDQALAIDPRYAHALWDKARVLYEHRHDYAGAIATWERFVEVGPPGQDREQALARIREARTRLATQPGAGATPPAASR